MKKTKVIVVGSGVIGAMTAIRLAASGCEVEIVSDESTYRLTSDVAAAFWYPFKCDLSESEERELAGSTLDFYLEWANAQDSGITIGAGEEYFDDLSTSNDRAPRWWAERFEVRAAELKAEEIPQTAGELGPFVAGWKFHVPIIDPQKFRQWLLKLGPARFRGLSRRTLNVRRLSDLRLDNPDVIVNCTGGWAGRLLSEADERLSGVQGVLVRVPDFDRTLAGNKLILIESGRSLHRPVYIVPHAENMPTVLGGTLGENAAGSRWDPNDESVWMADPELARQVIHRCACLRPKLNSLLLNPPLHPFRAVAGLRPFIADQPPRIREDFGFEEKYGVCLVHNYGHGGSGFTLCEGSADRVARFMAARGLLSDAAYEEGHQWWRKM